MIVPKLYPYGQNVEVPSRTLSLGGALVVDAAQFKGTSINTILEYIQSLRDSGSNGAITVQLYPILYQLGGGAYSITGVEFEGVLGTEIEFVGTSPVTRMLPDMAGYPARRQVTTGCLGPMFVSDRQPVAERLTFRNITFRGLTSAPLVAGDYYLMGIVSDNVTFDNCRWTNEHSATADIGSKAPYNALSKRNVSTLTLVHIGEDRWVEPNPEWCRPCSRITVRDCTFEGEPLGETSGAGVTLIGMRMRKCTGYQWHNNRFGTYYNTGTVIAQDLMATGNIANNDAVQLLWWEPYGKTYAITTYTWKDSPNPAIKTEVQRHASNASTSFLNLATAINAKRIDAPGGTDFVTALRSEEYLGQAGVASLRIQTATLDDPGPYAQGNHLAPYGPAEPVAMVTPTVDGGGVMSVRNINSGGTQSKYWKWGLILEDCFRGIVGPTDLGSEVFERSALYAVATLEHNNFTPMKFSENGHRVIYGWTGEQNVVGDALMHFRDSGFSNIYGNEFGIVAMGDGSTVGSVYKFQMGTNLRWWGQILATNADNNSQFEIHDSMGAVVTFTFKTSANPAVATEVQIGANNAATILNLRKAVQKKYDDHTLRAFIDWENLAGVGGALIFTITFVTSTVSSATPSVVILSDGGGKLAAFVASQPYRATHVMLDTQVHWPGKLTGGGAPVVWAEKFYGELYIRGHLTHLRPLAAEDSSQAVHTIAIALFNPANTNIFTLNSVAAGAPGNAFTITIKPGGGAETPGVAYFIDTTVNNDFHLLCTALTAKVKQANADGMAVWAFNFDPIVQIIDTAVGSNPNFVTGAGPDIGFPNPILINFPTPISNGAASVVTQGEHRPIVLKDVSWADIDVSAGPYTQGKYEGGPPPTSFQDKYWNSLASLDENCAFNGMPMKLLYVEKSDPLIHSKVKLRAMLDSSAWGPGVTGDARYYDLGTNMSGSDITVLASAIT